LYRKRGSQSQDEFCYGGVSNVLFNLNHYFYYIINKLIILIHIHTNLISRVGLAQLVKFLVVKLTYSGSNPKFDMSVTFMTNYLGEANP
jgi:hypothetical protein